ncbi:MAG: hypothetical protein ACYC8W_11930 [Candidatus Tyrphobacter sp.]
MPADEKMKLATDKPAHANLMWIAPVFWVGIVITVTWAIIGGH